MDKQELIQELVNIIDGYLRGENLDLVDLIYRYEGSDLFLRILVDRPQGGITMDECARINKDIGVVLDENGMVQDRYILEVSSPGIDRLLKSAKDFSRCIDKPVKLFLSQAVNEKIEMDGVIKDVGDDSVFIQTAQGLVEIPLTKINKAKQVI